MRRRSILSLVVLFAAVFVATCGPSSAWAQKRQSFLIFFHEWSAEIDEAGRGVIAAALAFAKENPGLPIVVAGYADTTGSRQANLYLSLLRAQLVSDMLVERGIAAERIARIGEGSVSFVATSQESRRVEIAIGAR